MKIVSTWKTLALAPNKKFFPLKLEGKKSWKFQLFRYSDKGITYCICEVGYKMKCYGVSNIVFLGTALGNH